MKKVFAIGLLFLAFTACVSRKKYNEVSNQAEKKAAEKAVLEEVLNKLAVENDSLNKLVTLLDSLYRYERDKGTVANNSRASDKALKLKLNKKLISGKEEYNKKAIFIYNFISYISWPSDTKDESFNIGIVGESPIKTPLAGYFQGKSINNKPVTVETYQPNKTYHILFFSENGSSNFNKIKKLAASKPVLLVTENILLEKIGSHISLYVDGAKVKYSVNKNGLEKTKLRVSEAFYSLSD